MLELKTSTGFNLACVKKVFDKSHFALFGFFLHETCQPRSQDLSSNPLEPVRRETMKVVGAYANCLMATLPCGEITADLLQVGF